MELDVISRVGIYVEGTTLFRDDRLLEALEFLMDKVRLAAIEGFIKFERSLFGINAEKL